MSSKTAFITLATALLAALEDSKNYSKGTYGPGVEDLLADAKEQIDAYAAEAEPSLEEQLAALTDEAREELLADYVLEEVPAEAPSLEEQLAALPTAERDLLLVPYLETAEPGTVAPQREFGTVAARDPDFWMVGNANFTLYEDAQNFITRHGFNGTPRPAGYLDVVGELVPEDATGE